jgi:hypothetical protein
MLREAKRQQDTPAEELADSSAAASDALGLVEPIREWGLVRRRRAAAQGSSMTPGRLRLHSHRELGWQKEDFLPERGAAGGGLLLEAMGLKRWRFTAPVVKLRAGPRCPSRSGDTIPPIAADDGLSGGPRRPRLTK